MKFYEKGTNPFNFMFIADLNKTSKAIDFKEKIEAWLDSIPKGKVSNWVVGNHDKSRVASRYGEKREDQLNLLSIVLPGIAVVYNGDEIGMVDRWFTWEETVDPAGCNAGPERFFVRSRDPVRTPYQWDNTKNSGFSNGPSTWLPVHDNYKTLNLAAQKKAPVSHYKVFQAVAKLKKTPVLQKGTTELVLVTDDVLAVVRRLAKRKTVTLLINFSDKVVTVDAKTEANILENGQIYIGSAKSGLKAGTKVNTSSLTIPGSASVILYT